MLQAVIVSIVVLISTFAIICVLIKFHNSILRYIDVRVDEESRILVERISRRMIKYDPTTLSVSDLDRVKLINEIGKSINWDLKWKADVSANHESTIEE